MAARQPWPPRRESTRRGGLLAPFPPWCPSLQAMASLVPAPSVSWDEGAGGEALFPLGLPASWVPFGGGERCTSRLLQQRSPQSSRSGSTRLGGQALPIPAPPLPRPSGRVPCTSTSAKSSPCADPYPPPSEGVYCGMQAPPLSPLHGCANEDHRETGQLPEAPLQPNPQSTAPLAPQVQTWCILHQGLQLPLSGPE